MKKHFFFAVLLPMALLGCAHGNKKDIESPYFWSAEAVANSSGGFIALKNNKTGKIYYNIEISRVKKLVEIHQRITSNAGQAKTALLLTTGEQANAFAFYVKHQPAIAVNIALLDLFSDDSDELAFVIGHELAHVYEKHGNLRKERRENLTIAANIGSLILGLAGIPGGGHLSSVVANGINNSYSRDEERDADRIGLNYAWKAGYSPFGGVRAQEKLGKVSSSSWLPLMNSHPPSAERTRELQALATELTGR